MTNESAIFRLLLTISITLFSLSGISAQPDDQSTKYEITISEAKPDIAIVSATFVPDDDKLYMFQGANQFPRRWAKFISHIKVFDSNGERANITAREGANWSIEKVSKEPITLSYQINLEHENHKWSGGVDGAAYVRDWGVFFTSRSLFIVNGEDRKNFQVSFNLPENWKISTPWNTKVNKGTFQVSDFSELATSIVFVGLHQQVSIQQDNFELLLAIGGNELIEQKDEFKKLAEGVFSYYSKLMGGVPILANSSTAKRTLVIINPAESTDGEAIGNNISILIKKNADQMSTVISRFIFAHEFFHLWNGKSFSPQSNDSEWFKEGVTNYYTLKSLHHVGFLDDYSYLKLLGDFFYQKYEADDGVGKFSLTQGDKKHQHWGLIYAGGFFVGIAQDMMIREQSANKNSLDDLMRTFFKRYAGTSFDYTLQDIKTELARLNQQQQNDFFERFITGTEKLPIENYLSMAGVKSTRKNKKLTFTMKENLSDTEKKLLYGLFGNQ